MANRVKAAQLLKERIHRMGCNVLGAPLWTEEEDNLCLRLFHDRKALKQALRRRSTSAINARCISLGLRVKNLHWWTMAEIAKLRRLYPTASWEELHEAFPGLSRKAIQTVASKRNIPRDKTPYKPTGDVLIDQIKSRCFDLGITLVELGASVGHKDFLRLYRKNGRKRADMERALDALDGQLNIEWK